MSLNSLGFLAFLCAVAVLYFTVPKSWQWRVLLIANYVFYLFTGVETVVFILFTTAATFWAGRKMQSVRENAQASIAAMGDAASREEKREAKKVFTAKIHKIQVGTVLLQLVLLATLKYLGLAFSGINGIIALFHWDAALPTVNLLVPLGLSYYTFNSIGYVVDVGRGKLEAEQSFGKYALFVSFFPSIVQGPLFRYGDVGIQLQQEHSFEYERVKFGAQLILWGFFKKMVIADHLAPVAATIFSAEFTNYTGSHILFGLLAYSFQIYGDFSGGTDITRGAAQILGIDLPVNFARPFFSISIADFWRRWHMSLGAWMREFVFYPVMLSGPVTNLSKKMRQKYGAYAGKMVPSIAAPMVVFFLIGIWHGLSWQYIANGFYNALAVSSGVALAPVYKKMTDKLKIRTEAFSWRLFQMVRTFFVIGVSRIIVKAPSLGEAGRMLKSLVTSFDPAFLLGMDGEIFTLGIDKKGLLVVAIGIVVLLIIGILQEMGVSIRESLAKQNILFRWGLILLLLAAVLVFGAYGEGYDASAFIYGNF